MKFLNDKLEIYTTALFEGTPRDFFILAASIPAALSVLMEGGKDLQKLEESCLIEASQTRPFVKDPCIEETGIPALITISLAITFAYCSGKIASITYDKIQKNRKLPAPIEP